MNTLLQWALSSFVLILIVLALRAGLKNKLSARCRYALWAVVLVRLLVPFQVALPASASPFLPLLASNLAPEVADVELYALRTGSRPMSEDDLQDLWDIGREPGDVLACETNIHTFGSLEVEGSTHCYVLSDTGVDTYFFYTTLPRALITLWAIGAIVTAWAVFQSNRYFWRRLKCCRHSLDGGDAPIPVYTAACLPSPCLFGVLRPAVYVTPDAANDPSALRHVLAHELTHYAHKDHIWSLLRCLALALHWYDPLVWLAVVLSKRDGELACDEGAVACLGEEERVPYGRTLVDMVARRARPADLLSCSTAMTGGKKSIQQRIALLVKKPQTVKAALFAAAAAVALAAVFTFAGRTEPAPKVPDLHDFRFQVEQAQAIRYAPPPYSDTFYPHPTITDTDLLEEAKTVLGTARDLMNVPEELDLSDAEFVSASVTLVDTGRDPAEENTYQLYRWNDKTYVLAQDGSRYIPIVVMDASVDALSSIAKRQCGTWMPLSREEVLSSALSNYTEIQFQFSHMGTVYPAITDPDLLEQAAEVLRTAGDPGDGTMEGGGAQVSIRDEHGERLTNFPLSNGEMIRTLDRLTMEQWERDRAADGLVNELTQEQLDRANEALRTEVEQPGGRLTRPSEISCFFTSSYSKPSEIDLYEFLYYCPLAEILTDEDVEEFRAAVAESTDWEKPEKFRLPSDFPLPVKRYPREAVSALLQKYAGVTVEELDWQPDLLIYLEKYDAFYNFTSDYGPGMFQCVGGAVEGDAVRLWSDLTEHGGRRELTLRQENGTWLIQSFRTVSLR